MNYTKVCSSLLKNLPPKMSDVVERRFGLKTGNKETLEAIGKNYNITRERVRQIEREGFSKINLDNSEYIKVLEHFNKAFESFGNIREEKALFASLGNNQNQVYFLLTLGQDFERFSEDKEFHSLWAKNSKAVDLAKKVINLTLNKLKQKENPISIEELLNTEKAEFVKIIDKINKNILNCCLEVSKQIKKNPEGQFGLINWVEINPRGIKDKAYLILKKQGKPLHFTQVAGLIKESPYCSKNKIHTATVHNELIKDLRFVLVGRGLYGLKEWGYEPGVVKDIISKVLVRAKKSLSKDEVLKEVLGQRFVKENTILLNLQNKDCFLRDSQGRYTVIKS